MDLETLGKLDQEVTAIVNSGATGPKLWRKVIEVGVRYNPTIRSDIKTVSSENKDRRAALKDEKFGESDTKSHRHALSIPASVWYLLQIADPEIMQYPNVAEKLHQTFPWARVSEKV